MLAAALSESESNGILGTGASALVFTPDSRRLVLATWTGARIVLLDLDEQAREEVVRVFDSHREKDPDGDKDEQNEGVRVARVGVSPDCQWLATADSTGRVCVFNMDSVKVGPSLFHIFGACLMFYVSQHIVSLARTALPPTALAFDPRAPHVLALGYPNNAIELFDAEACKFYPPVQPAAQLVHQSDPLLGIVFHPDTKAGGTRKMYIWAANWLARIDVATPKVDALLKTPVGPANPGAEKKLGKKAALKRKRGEGDDAFAMVTKFRPVLMVDFCTPSLEGGEAEMVIVERPLVDLLATLPPAYLKSKYGAS